VRTLKSQAQHTKNTTQRQKVQHNNNSMKTWT
jgi:hypothetical protein